MKIKIKQGKSYPFKISGQVILPNGNECFILIDPNKVKHLLKTKHYLHYNPLFALQSETRTKY